MKYCWASNAIMPDAWNFGNRLIEHCLRSILGFDESREITINIYRRLSKEERARIEDCAFTVLPGCTLIQRGEHPGMEDLCRTTPRKFCFGGAFFTRLVLPSPAYCRAIEKPIGARDTFTHAHLRLYGIQSRLVGCPTLFCGRANGWHANGGPVVFNLGRDSIGQQMRVFEQVRKECPVRVVIQVEQQRRYFPPGTEFVEYNDVEGVIKAYANASVVVTGRLHGALPAIAAGTPVVFSQLIPDSRISLLRYLGVRIHNPYSKRLVSIIRNFRENRERDSDRVFVRVTELREAFLDYVENFRSQVGGGA